MVGFPIRKFSDQNLLTAPETYRSISRPSSAFSAKASLPALKRAVYTEKNFFCIESNFYFEH